jgi:DNA replication protein DnaC
MAATAMVDRRLIHYSEILSLRGDSYRLRGKELDPGWDAAPISV